MLHLIERRNNRSRFQSSTAAIDAHNVGYRAPCEKRVPDLLFQIGCEYITQKQLVMFTAKAPAADHSEPIMFEGVNQPTINRSIRVFRE